MKRGNLSLTLRPGEILTIGDAIVMLEHYSGKQIRIKINAPVSIKINRLDNSKNASLHLETDDQKKRTR